MHTPSAHQTLGGKVTFPDHHSIHEHGIPVDVEHGAGTLIRLIIVHIQLKCPFIGALVNLGVLLVSQKIPGNRADAIACDGVEPYPILSKSDKGMFFAGHRNFSLQILLLLITV